MDRVNENIALPLTREFNSPGEQVGILTIATVTQIRSQGFIISNRSRTGISDGSGNNYNFYATTTDGGLSAGSHSVTFIGA